MTAISEKKSIPETEAGRLKNHPAFGMWADREDMKDPAEWVRKLRSSRHEGLFDIAAPVFLWRNTL